MTMKLHRRDFLKSASLGIAALAAGKPANLLAYEGEESVKGNHPSAYKHRIAFGALVNDMRNDPLPLENWPAPQFDDETVDSIIRALDVQSEAGFKMLDVFGLYTTSYPPDVSSILDDDRRRRLKKLSRAAEQRGMKFMLCFGLMSSGFQKIVAADESVRAYSVGPGGEKIWATNALCGAKEKS